MTRSRPLARPVAGLCRWQIPFAASQAAQVPGPFHEPRTDERANGLLSPALSSLGGGEGDFILGVDPGAALPPPSNLLRHKNYGGQGSPTEGAGPGLFSGHPSGISVWLAALARRRAVRLTYRHVHLNLPGWKICRCFKPCCGLIWNLGLDEFC